MRYLQEPKSERQKVEWWWSGAGERRNWGAVFFFFNKYRVLVLQVEKVPEIIPLPTNVLAYDNLPLQRQQGFMGMHFHWNRE